MNDPPHRVALADRSTKPERQLALLEDACARGRRALGGPVLGARIDDDDVVEQVDAAERPDRALDHPADRRGALLGGKSPSWLPLRRLAGRSPRRGSGVAHARSRRRGTTRPIGELDLATVSLLEAAFEAAFRDDGVELIVVDLTELGFIDSTGIHLLVRMRAACEDGDRLRVINGSRQVERVLDLTGVRARLPIISSEHPLA